MAPRPSFAPPLKTTLDITHMPFLRPVSFATRAQAEEGARQRNLCRYRAPIKAVTRMGYIWVLRDSGKWVWDTQLLLTTSGDWVPLTPSPYKNYDCPLNGAPERWLKAVETDYPEGSATRLLHGAVMAVLLTSVAARKKRGLLLLEDLDKAMTPALKTLARMWDMEGAHNADVLSIMGAVLTIGPSSALLNVLHLARAMGALHPNGVIQIVEFEAQAAAMLGGRQDTDEDDEE